MANNTQTLLRSLTSAELTRIADRVAVRLGEQIESAVLTMLDEWFTVESLAAYLNLSQSYIFKNADILGGIKLDKRWYFSRKNINELLRAQPSSLSVRERELLMKIRQEQRGIMSMTQIREQLEKMRNHKNDPQPSIL